jgi:integrase
MANNVKYLRHIKATKKWAFSPTPAVKEALEVGFEQYETLQDAAFRCAEVEKLYEEWKLDQQREVKVNSATVLGMIGYYKTTDRWRRLSDNSHRTYNQLIHCLSGISLGKERFFNMMASNVRKDYAQKLYAYIQENYSQHRARHSIKFLKLVWNVCEENDKLRGNPWKAISLDSDPICDVIWKDRQVDRFIEGADELGFWSLGTMAMLCYDLCQRPGDMRQLTWDNFDGEFFTFHQEKTGTKIEVEASPRLIKRIVPRHNQYTGEDTIVLYENTERPYDSRKYNEIAAQIRKHTMLPDRLKMKFLRHSGATQLGENNATEDEIAAVTGHKSRAMLNIYVKKTRKLASSAQAKRFG